MIRPCFAALILLMPVQSVSANSVDDTSPDLQRGAELALSRCEACHAAAMLTQATVFPSLGGQKQAYLYKQLLDFRSGKRTDASMQAQLINLSDQQLKDLALYYSKQSPLELNAMDR